MKGWVKDRHVEVNPANSQNEKKKKEHRHILKRKLEYLWLKNRWENNVMKNCKIKILLNGDENTKNKGK